LGVSGLITLLMLYFGAQGMLAGKGAVGDIAHSYQIFLNYVWPWYLYGAWCGFASIVFVFDKLAKFKKFHFLFIFLPWLIVLVVQGNQALIYAIPLFIIIYLIITLGSHFIEKKVVATNEALKKFQQANRE
ncbi:MAG: hypothetical protein ACRCV7_05035, partial [Culicoidibacterales bacterium]